MPHDRLAIPVVSSTHRQAGICLRQAGQPVTYPTTMRNHSSAGPFRSFVALASLLLVAVFLSSCALLDPQRPIIPTPIPTAPSLEDSLGLNLEEAVTNPVSDVIPDIDPDIQFLVNSVSQDQLLSYVFQLDSFGTRNAFSDPLRDDFGVGAARRWIFNEFVNVSNGRLNVRFDDFPLNYNGFAADQRNVIATLPGTTGSDDVIVLMAHYDTRPVDVTDGFSRAPGANDNGSGVALLLESARILSARQWNTTIVFAALAAEEQGTYGSKNLVQKLVLDGFNVTAAFNYDTVGGRPDIPRSIRLFAPDLSQSGSGQIARYYKYINSLYMPTFTVSVIDGLDREGRWGDQREFVYAGLPAVRLTESIEDPDLVNSSRDSWNVIDYSYLQQVTQLNVAAVANMAGAPPPPSLPSVVHMADPGSFLITWTPDLRAAGYAIAFRPLSTADYPPFRLVSLNDAGNVVLTGIEPEELYAISIAAIDSNGRLSLFSPEQVMAGRQ